MRPAPRPHAPRWHCTTPRAQCSGSTDPQICPVVSSATSPCLQQECSLWAAAQSKRDQHLPLPTKSDVPLFATTARIIPLDIFGEILGETLRLFDVTTWTSSSIPSSSEVYRGYNPRTPGSVSSAACIASKSVAGNEASARAKKRSVEAQGEGIVSAERARECGVTPCNCTAKREIHVAAVQTRGSSEHVRHALCSAVVHRAVCVRVVSSVSVLFVCPFLRLGHHEVSPHWPLPARLHQGRDLCALHAGRSGYTLPQPLCGQYQDPEPLALPWTAGNQSSVSKVCQSLPRKPLGQKLLAVLRSAPMPVVALKILAGCIPPKRVTLKSPSASRLPCTETSPIEDSDESVIQPYGWVMSGWKSIPVDFLFTVQTWTPS